MPEYDFRCLDCGRAASLFLTFVEYDTAAPRCPHCGSPHLRRRIRGVRYARSEDSRLESLSDPGSWGDVDESDPRSMAKMMRRMSREVGEDMGPEFDEAVDRLEAGQNPDEVEGSLPDADAGGGEDLDDF